MSYFTLINQGLNSVRCHLTKVSCHLTEFILDSNKFILELGNLFICFSKHN